MKLYLPEIYNLLLHDLIDEKDLDKIKFKKNMTVSELQKYVKSIVSKKLKRKQKKHVIRCKTKTNVYKNCNMIFFNL